jgi:hypothetical protein
MTRSVKVSPGRQFQQGSLTPVSPDNCIRGHSESMLSVQLKRVSSVEKFQITLWREGLWQRELKRGVSACDRGNERN